MEATFRAIKARYGDLSPDGADHFQAMPSSDPPTVRASRIESGARQSLGPQYWVATEMCLKTSGHRRGGHSCDSVPRRTRSHDRDRRALCRLAGQRRCRSASRSADQGDRWTTKRLRFRRRVTTTIVTDASAAVEVITRTKTRARLQNLIPADATCWVPDGLLDAEVLAVLRRWAPTSPLRRCRHRRWQPVDNPISAISITSVAGSSALIVRLIASLSLLLNRPGGCARCQGSGGAPLRS